MRSKAYVAGESSEARGSCGRGSGDEVGTETSAALPTTWQVGGQSGSGGRGGEGWRPRSPPSLRPERHQHEVDQLRRQMPPTSASRTTRDGRSPDLGRQHLRFEEADEGVEHRLGAPRPRRRRLEEDQPPVQGVGGEVPKCHLVPPPTSPEAAPPPGPAATPGVAMFAATATAAVPRCYSSDATGICANLTPSPGKAAGE